jgi:UDP-N-acetylmuramate dehydrogenase
MLEIVKNRILAPYTTLKIGGPAQFFCEPCGIGELQEALRFASGNDLRAVWFGGGSNLLIHDRGVDGVVIRLSRRFSQIIVEKDEVVAEAGCWLPSLMKFGCEKGVLDLSCCAGIPGTVGGAVFMNAGTKMGTISEKIRWVELMNAATGEQERRAHTEMDFGYRKSVLLEGNLIATRVGFRRDEGDGKAWWKEVREQIQWRKKSQPKGVRSAGCFFENPANRSAGELIDRAGLKGTRVGDAVVSAVHANFLVNEGHATCEDLLNLASKVRKSVFDSFDIKLRLEVKLLGFSEAELYAFDGDSG